MALKNTQICGAQISVEWTCKSKKLKVDISATPRKSSVTGAIITLKAETNYSFPQLRERGLRKPVSKCIVLSQHF